MTKDKPNIKKKPAKQKRPDATKQAGHKRKRKARRRPSSTRRQNNAVGLLVFLIGLGAVLAAGYALSQRGPVTIMGTEFDLKRLMDNLITFENSEDPSAMDGQKAGMKSGADNASRKTRSDSQSYRQSLAQAKPWYERDLNASALPEKYAGHYMAHFGSRKFELYLKDGVYQIVFLEAEQELRYYSKGRYGYHKGLLALKPEPEMGQPNDPNNEFDYRPMTKEIYVVRPEAMNGFLTWSPAAKNFNGVQRVAKHPVFEFVDANRIIWQTLNMASANTKQ